MMLYISYVEMFMEDQYGSKNKHAAFVLYVFGKQRHTLLR